MTLAESIARSLYKGMAAFAVTGSILYLNHFPWSDANTMQGFLPLH